MTGWTKPKGGAAYAGVSERTFGPWLQSGLRHIRLKSGTILIKVEWIDRFLESFEVQQADYVGKIVDEVLNDL